MGCAYTGDPESALRWTCKSVRKLAQELSRGGHRVSHRLVAELLHDLARLSQFLTGNSRK